MIKPIISLFVILFSLGFGFFYAKPKYDDVQSTRADLLQLTQTSQSASDIKDIINETQKSLKNINPDDLARFNVFLPETLDGIRFANDLQHIGTTNGLILSDIKVDEQKKDNKPATATKPAVTQPASASGVMVKALSVPNTVGDGATPQPTTGGTAEKKYIATRASFAFAATYSGFLLFLDDLEKSLGLINITSLSFKELSNSSEEKVTQSNLPSLYQFNIEIETYSLK